MKYIRLLFIILLFTADGFAYSVADKVSLEKSQAERAQQVLENILGKSNILVYVNLELDTMQSNKEKETYITKDNGKGSSKWIFDQKQQTPSKYYLPGYPVEGSGGISNMPEKMERTIEQSMEMPKTVIKRENVVVLVSAEIGDQNLRSVPQIVAGVLNLDKDRGDTVIVRKMPFLSPITVLFNELKMPEVLSIVAKYLILIVLALMVIFVFFLLAKDFLKNINIAVNALRSRMEVSIENKAAEAILGGKRDVSSEDNKSMLSLTDAQGMPAGMPEMPQAASKRHFSFIHEKNIYKLAHLLKKESPENVAIALSYLKPQDASTLLGTLTQETRTSVTNKLANNIETSPEVVKQIESNMREKIDYLLGGNEFLLEILDLTDDKTREMLLADIATQNLDMAEQLRNELFLFRDIEFLNDEEMKRVIEDINNDTMALALRGQPDAVINKFVDNLSKGAQQALKQTIELMGPQALSKVEDAKKSIVARVRQLIKDGLVAKRKIKKIEAFQVEVEKTI
jgi:flagellar motor switch protein FliG